MALSLTHLCRDIAQPYLSLIANRNRSYFASAGNGRQTICEIVWEIWSAFSAGRYPVMAMPLLQTMITPLVLTAATHHV